MGDYVVIGRLRTWYDEQGAGDPLVLLHGGLSTNESWAAQTPALAEHFRVVAPERRAHGHTPDLEGPLSYDDMATDTIGFLESRLMGQHILSVGATVASSDCSLRSLALISCTSSS